MIISLLFPDPGTPVSECTICWRLGLSVKLMGFDCLLNDLANMLGFDFLQLLAKLYQN